MFYSINILTAQGIGMFYSINILTATRYWDVLQYLYSHSYKVLGSFTVLIFSQPQGIGMFYSINILTAQGIGMFYSINILTATRYWDVLQY